MAKTSTGLLHRDASGAAARRITAGHHSRCGCTETVPVTPEVFGLLPAVTYNLRAQTGGREAQERPMTACIDNSRAGLAGA